MRRLIDIYDVIKECDYKGEHYSVRDNGAVMRHSVEGKKPRVLDNTWTFGTIDRRSGYTRVGSERVHRVVATAFLGEPPSTQYIVDHIDTNRQNNRPDNLRWITKLDNVFLNDITRKKLELICGCSIEEIANDWSMLQSKNLTPDISWMKAVSKEEAIKSLNSWKKWVQEVDSRKEYDRNTIKQFNRTNNLIHVMIYPLEPKEDDKSLNDYYENMKNGTVFCYKDYNTRRISYEILDYHLNKDLKTLYVATKSSDKEGIKVLFLTEVTIRNNEYEYSTRSFFGADGLEKYMTIARGEEWTGGEVMDDYC